ncbi:hypothetical protein QEJ31_03555 [Pigmentibacter sp. JX0631]|nr:hypothetical protein [Pigmentibacter sp. JX0631]WGL60678.1 hypothetical protein QEJ31_03555 [Pigmentibacter sp. JX0631]
MGIIRYNPHKSVNEEGDTFVKVKTLDKLKELGICSEANSETTSEDKE